MILPPAVTPKAAEIAPDFLSQLRTRPDFSRFNAKRQKSGLKMRGFDRLNVFTESPNLIS